MSKPVRLAIAGAGLIGQRHAAAIAAAPSSVLTGIADPSPAAQRFAAALDVPWYSDIEALLASQSADGVILATPNALHVEGGLACIEAGLPLLVEKPVAADLAGGRRLVEAARAAGVPLAVGHHRRHNPIIAKAKALIEAGELGSITAAHVTAWFRKPDRYFDAAWRREPGGGPLAINMIHEVDLLQHLCGPVATVQAMTSNARRGFAVEDTAAVLLRFEGGALGTITLSDTIAAPWSWELTARENPAYPATNETSMWIGGTGGSLAIPNLALWHHPAEPSWWAPIAATTPVVTHADPLICQIEQFAAVIRDGAAPLVSGEDGLAALAIVEAIGEAAASGLALEPQR
jgi:predicted dehydrogenase